MRPRTSSTWFRGDCHVHSIHSDGELTPAQLAGAARSLALDFVATTDHNTASAHQPWQDSSDSLLVMSGVEVTTRDGHWLAVGLPVGHEVDWRYTAIDDAINAQVDAVHAVGGLCIVAHPHAPYPTGTFRYGYDGFDAVEVWNGQWDSDLPWQADNEAALDHWSHSLIAEVEGGGWRPAVGNSDAHLDGQLAHPHTVVAAQVLSAPDILAGIKSGRSWLASCPSIELVFNAVAADRSAGIGERLIARGEPIVVTVTVQGIDEGTITIHTAHGETHRRTSSALRTVIPADALFVRVEIRSPDGLMLAMTNPIILG